MDGSKPFCGDGCLTPPHSSAFTDKGEARQLSRFVAEVATKLADLMQSVPTFQPEWTVVVEAGSGELWALQKDLSLNTNRSQGDPANTQWQHDLSGSHIKIGDVLVAQGDGPGALAAYQAGLAIREVLAKRDPANTQWQVDLAVSCSMLSSVASVLPPFTRKEHLQRGEAAPAR